MSWPVPRHVINAQDPHFPGLLVHLVDDDVWVGQGGLLARARNAAWTAQIRMLGKLGGSLAKSGTDAMRCFRVRCRDVLADFFEISPGEPRPADPHASKLRQVSAISSSVAKAPARAWARAASTPARCSGLSRGSPDLIRSTYAMSPSATSIWSASGSAATARNAFWSAAFMG